MRIHPCFNPRVADSMETLRAAVEVAFPGGDGIPTGLDAGADRHIADALESVLPGAVDLLAALLDASAAEQGGVDGFAAMPADGRAQVLRAMLREPVADVRELAESILMFGAGAIFSEWSGYDRPTRALTPPSVWTRIGFGGPSLGHPEYLDG
jgi:hypothetical protein